MGQWPSAELKPPGRRVARITGILWWLLFALGIVAVLGGIATSIEQVLDPSGFNRTGLAVNPTDECIQVIPWNRTAHESWPEGVNSIDGGCVVGVGAAPVAASSSRETVAALLDGPIGTKVKVALVGDDGEIAEAEFPRVAPGWYDLALLAFDTLVAALYPLVALLLWLRRRNDPVSRRISFAFLLVGHLGRGAMAFWSGTGAYFLLAAVGALVAVVTLPAYPNGIYVPRVARWLQVLPFAALAAIAVDLSATDGAATGAVVVGTALLLPVGLLLFILRYFRMPPGLEKQQVKWAVLGISIGILLMIAGYFSGMAPETAVANPGAFTWSYALGDLLEVLGFAAIPAGVGVSLFEYRLNDVDAAAGKSLGYAIVTVIVAVVWALIQSVVGDLFKQWLSGPAVTAVTTVIAALVFTPARSYVLAWTEKKFQPALVRLRKLPDKLVRWQTCDSPDELANAALADLVPGVGAAYAAVLGDDGREWRVLAAHGIEPDKAAALLEAERPPERRDDPFPIRRELADQLGRPDLLAIGPRSDGASFTKDEKAAIAMIVDPLSSAIEAAALRERHILKVEDSLAGIDQRLGRIEVKLAPRASRAASRRSPKGSSAAGRSSRT